MKRSAVVLVAFSLVGCTTLDWEPQWAKERNAVVASRPDHAAQAMIKCDSLFLRSGEAHRLCVMRDIDRLGVQVVEGSQARSSLPLGPVLPYAYPPLAPSVAYPPNVIYAPVAPVPAPAIQGYRP